MRHLVLSPELAEALRLDIQAQTAAEGFIDGLSFDPHSSLGYRTHAEFEHRAAISKAA